MALSKAQAPVQTAEPPAPPRPETVFPFILIASDDRMRAELSAEGQTAGWGVADVKKFLAEQKIAYGIAADEKIQSFLNEAAAPLVVAEGRPPQPGKNAQVRYNFDRDPLKIGTLRAGGSIDFKAKGEIPQVKEGFLLAEKTPLVKEIDGVDIYGTRIPADRPNDILIFAGGGVKTSADGLKFFAAANGRPELLADGKLCVLPELRIDGDVGLETGHIDFDGYVDVSGVVQEGFRVRAGRLSAREIRKAEIETEGDITIDGGIIGAKITCRGNLRARYIHSSRIEVLGNVFVDAEVIDSRIEANGNFTASYGSGKIFSSHIAARRGVEVFQIGSASSRPCSISLNVNAATTNLISRMRTEIQRQEAVQQRCKAGIEDLKKEWNHIEQEIGKTAQMQDKALQSQRAAQTKFEDGKKRGDSAGIAQAKAELERLKSKISGLEKNLEQMMARQDEVSARIPALKQNIESAERIAEELSKSIEGMASEKTKSPVIKVSDILFAGTELKALQSSLTVKENLERVVIEEKQVKVSGPEGPRLAWSLEVKSLA